MKNGGLKSTLKQLKVEIVTWKADINFIVSLGGIEVCTAEKVLYPTLSCI